MWQKIGIDFNRFMTRVTLTPYRDGEDNIRFKVSAAGE